MAIVTGFTAERMLQIENETIVDANLVGDRLILVTREGTVIDVGSVRGPEGPEGHVPTLADLGITATLPEINKLQGLLPTTAELNYVDGVTSAIQDQINGKAASGHIHDDRYYTEAEMISLLLGKAPTSHTHAFGDLVAPTELGVAVNMNDVVAPGDYTQTSNAEAAGGTNYPIAQAGFLRVRTNAAGGNSMVWQEYIPYLGTSMTTFWRCRYNGVWGAWRTILAEEGRPAFPLFRAKISGMDRNLASGVNTITSWTKERDTSASGSAFNATTGLYTIPVSGNYMYGLNVKFATANTRRFIAVEVGGIEMIREEGPATGYSALSLVTEDYFASGEVLTPKVYATSAVTGGIEVSATPAGFWAHKTSD